MKKHSLAVLILLISYSVFSQKAEPILSYAKVQNPMSWYRQQILAWQSMVERDAKSEQAWHNYFKAQRVVSMQDTADKRSEKERDGELYDIVEAMQKAIPNTYTTNYCKWVLHGNDMKFYAYLEKAVAIDPNRKDHIDYMINIGEMERDIPQRNEYSLKRIQAGEMSTGMLYYNYNALVGLEQNAILLTSGDNDTYPAWALQAKGIRTDVKVINIYLLHIRDYREKIFAELGVENVALNEESESDFFNTKLVQHLNSNSKKYPIYVALTSAGCNKFMDIIQQDLYLTGLAYAYKTSSFDNIAVMKKNVEQLFALDYIDRGFYDEISIERVKEINRNYIVPMLKLYQHYTESGDMQKESWIKEKLMLISKGTEDEETVLKYLD